LKSAGFRYKFQTVIPKRENYIGNKIYRYRYVAQMIERPHEGKMIVRIDETKFSTYNHKKRKWRSQAKNLLIEDG